ncbi:MAG: ATP-dependent RNA helicase HrpA, partial [Micromonosporaceae bacterium]
FLNYLRVREWQDIYQQLRRTARTLGASLNSTPADPDRIHASLLAGLLSHIGVRDLAASDPRRRREYLGARGSRFAISPGSALFKRLPEWVMVAELVETTRLWGHTAAAIKPEWVEPLAGHLVKRSYSQPHWDRDRGGVVAYETVTLYGLPVVSRRRVDYGRIDPALSRELFIRHALVEGDWDTHHRFFHDNMALLARVAELEDRARRRDILVDDDAIFAFFDKRIGPEVVSTATFDRWWKKVRRDRPDLLTLTMEDLVDPRAGRVSESDYPQVWRHGDVDLPLTYQFEPGAATDGVTVHVPLALLDQIEDAGFDWQVPGLRRDLVIALIRSLPKPVRRAFVPVPEVADQALERMEPYAEPLRVALARVLSQLGGTPVGPDDFDLDRVPDHLRMTVRVVGDDGTTLAEGRDPAALRRRLAPQAAASLSAAASAVERTGLTSWTVGTVPRQVEVVRGGRPVTAYPALVDAGDRVDLRVFATPREQARHMPAGVRRLLLLDTPSPEGYVLARLSEEAKLALVRNPHGGVRELLADCAACAVDALVAEHGGPPWDEAGYAELRRKVRAALNRATLGVVTEVLPVLNLAGELAPRLQAAAARYPESVADMRAQLESLVRPGFVTATGWQRLPDLTRYLTALRRRLDKLPSQPDRDRQAMAQVHQVREAYERLRACDGADPQVERIGWMIEELRVSLFAQQLGTAHPVSVPRIRRAIEELTPSA